MPGIDGSGEDAAAGEEVDIAKLLTLYLNPLANRVPRKNG
jgi:hypothetical protein